MLCLVVLPFVISCTGSSETNKSGISSESQSTLQDISPDNGMETITNSIGMKPELIELPEDYFKNAGRVAQIPATEAGYRLAAVWRQCFGELGE